METVSAVESRFFGFEQAEKGNPSSVGNRWQEDQWEVLHGSKPGYQDSVIQLTKEERRDGGTSKVVIDVDKLKYVFLDPRYKNYHVAVYTIAGPFRSGKSFLQNLLGSYLHRLENGEYDGSTSKEIETFFKARGGRKPHTEGIHILRKPFLLDFEQSGKQKKVALFLVDTQGLFDLKASIEKITVIGTLSIAISSLQCFNVKERIDRVHLEYIYKFAQKALDIKKKDEESSLIEKKSLMFIIRDWFRDDEETEDDYPFGFRGGRKYFKETLNPADGHAEEHEMMSEYLENTFGEIPCCLLPHPGEAVRSAKIESEKDLDEEFQNHLKQLFKQITTKEKLVIKKIDGQNATCADLCSRMEAFASMLKQDMSLEDVQSIIQADYEARMNNIATPCINKFVEKVQKSAESFRKKSEEDIKKKLISMQEEAVKDYELVRKPGGKKFQGEWLSEYCNLLSQISEGFETCAALEKLYVNLIKDFNDWRKKTETLDKMKDDTFKEQAQKKREKLSAKFRNSISEEFFVQCETYFKNDINKLIAETEAEVKKYLESLEKPWWKTALKMGALVVSGVGGAIGVVGMNAIFAAIDARKAKAAGVALHKAIANHTSYIAKPKKSEEKLPLDVVAANAAFAANDAEKAEAAGVALHKPVANQNLKHTSNIVKPKETEEKLALTKYEESVIHVMLCFGQVQFRLLSKENCDATS